MHGKTSTIKAIANYTQRHIIALSLGKIESKVELIRLFCSDYINHRKVPLNKRLYVVEDIDCSSLQDAVQDRNSRRSEETHSIADNDNTVHLKLDIPRITEPVSAANMLAKKPELTMADVLEVLDGVLEMDGRMLVITTNYPEKLDAALTRPGRIDIKIHFGRCTSDSLVQMYKQFFTSPGAKNSNNILPRGYCPRLPENCWTPAEVCQLLLQNVKDPRQSLKQLEQGKH